MILDGFHYRMYQVTLNEQTDQISIILWQKETKSSPYILFIRMWVSNRRENQFYIIFDICEEIFF